MGIRARLATICLWTVALIPAACGWADDAIDYELQIKPLLRQRCFACHGALKQAASLRLDTFAFMAAGGDSGPAVLPGQSAESLIIQRDAAGDIDDRMPPEHEGEPFSADQIALLSRWVQQGAPAPPDEPAESDPRQHWAFQPIVQPPVPFQVGDS